MNNTKTTKRALLASVMAMLLCVAMLVGTTFAWFTDSTSTGVNKIQAGTLEVQLLDKDGNSLEGQTLTWQKAQGAENEEVLWEPNCTYDLQSFEVKNVGNLALKYKLVISGINGDAKLNEAIEWSYKLANGSDFDVEVEHYLKPGESTGLITISGHMKSDAGNEYQDLSIDGIGITVVAAQYTYEHDSNDDQYDADAEYPVATAEEFVAALEAIETKGTIVLGNHILLIDTPITIAGGKDITIDTSNYTIKSIWTPASASAAFEVKENSVLTLKGSGSVEAYAENPDVTWAAGFPGYANNAITNRGTLIIDGATVKVTTDKVGENGELGASYCIDAYAGSKLVLKSGSIVNPQNIAVRIFTSDASKSVDVTVDGGIIEGSRAIWLQLAGSSSSVAPKVNLVINGGEIKTNEAFDDIDNYCLALYSYSFGNSFANTNVTINGGDFLGYVAFGGGYKGDRETVTINGGTFTAYNVDGTVDTDCVGRYTSTDPYWESIEH